MEAKQRPYECNKCHREFYVKSNLTKHFKTHEEKLLQCPGCSKKFTLKQNLNRHSKQHFYPAIPSFKSGEARLKCSQEATHVAGRSYKTPVDNEWHPEKAESDARGISGSLWRSSLVIQFGKYSGQSFKWLLENDVGLVVWLLDAFSIHGEKCSSMLWQKERLLEFVNEFPSVKCHLDNKLKVSFKYNEQYLTIILGVVSLGSHVASCICIK